MASLSTSDAGLHRVLFKDAAGKRQTLYLGRIPKRNAEGIQRCMTELERAALYASTPADFASSWLTQIGDDMHAKLVRFGLARPKAVSLEPAVSIVTFDDLIDRYKARPKWAAKAPGTRKDNNSSFTHLRNHFGGARDIATITEIDAEDMIDALGQIRAEATCGKVTNAGSMLMRFAVRSGWIRINPFEGIRRGSGVTPHKAYVDVETTMKLIEGCLDAETRLVVALARFAGLRTPSEPRVLRWADVDWSGNRFSFISPKTGPRTTPILPELRPFLDDAWNNAPEGSELVIPQAAVTGQTAYAKRVLRVIERLKLGRWPRVFHALRASLQTDLTERFPGHVVAGWLGNSTIVADRHYNRVLESHFAEATRNPTQHLQESPEMTGKEPSPLPFNSR